MKRKIISFVVVMALAVTGIAVVSPMHKKVSASIASPSENVWELSWSDEFNGSSLDTSVWNYQVGPGKNNEAQCYRQENVSVDEGCLKLRAQKEDNPYSYNNKNYNYTSGRIDTKHKKWFKYGKIEAKIKVDNGNHNGLWPAFWMQGEDRDEKGWPKCGEVDIMEHANDRDYYTGAVHWTNSSGKQADQSKECYFDDNSNHGIDDWHTYTIVWDETQIRWYLDYEKTENPTPFYTQKTSASDSSSLNACINETKSPNDGFYLLLNLAIGSSNTSYTGGLVPDANFESATMNVDYVRAYQYNPNPSSSVLPTTTVEETTTEEPTTVEQTETEGVTDSLTPESLENIDLTYYNAANDHLTVPLGNYNVYFHVHRARIGICPNNPEHIRIENKGGNAYDEWALTVKFSLSGYPYDKQYKIRWTAESSEEADIAIRGKGSRHLNKGVNIIELTDNGSSLNHLELGLSKIPYDTILDLYNLTITEESTGEVVYPAQDEPTEPEIETPTTTQTPTETTTAEPATVTQAPTETTTIHQETTTNQIETTTEKPGSIVEYYRGEEYLEIQDETDSGYYPKDGYVFAGWFKDKDCKQVYNFGGNAYAKYIDEKVLDVKFQTNDNFTAIRSVSTIDSLNYEKVGFIISGEYGSKIIPTQEKEITKVYSSVIADKKKVDPKTYSNASKYFFTYTVRNINTKKDVDLTIQPYFVTLDGTKVLGESKDFYLPADD